jgi:hypothetical protein
LKTRPSPRTGRPAWLAAAGLALWLTALPAQADGPDIEDRRLDEETLDRAFGERRVSYFVHGLGLSGQFLIGLNVGAPTRLLPDGNYLFSGCRHHSCHENAAVIATPSGSILAGGLIHFQCLGADEQPLPDPCDDKHRLAVFVKPTDASAPHYRKTLETWARTVSTVDVVEMRAIR